MPVDGGGSPFFVSSALRAWTARHSSRCGCFNGGSGTGAGALIGGEVKQAALVISATEGVGPWSGPIKIVGHGKVGDRELVREARYAVVVWGTQNRQSQRPEFRLTRSLQLGIIDKDVEPAFVQIGEDKVWETSLGGNIEIPITLTRRGDYAVRAMLALATFSEEPGRISARRLADLMAIPARFLPHVLHDLSQAGLVEGQIGRSGGYRLARRPARITLLEIVEAAEGDGGQPTCVLRGGPCRPAPTPSIHRWARRARTRPVPATWTSWKT